MMTNILPANNTTNISFPNILCQKLSKKDIGAQVKQAVSFLTTFKEELLYGYYPQNGLYLLLEDASGMFIDEDEVFNKLVLITNDYEYARKMSCLYDQFYKINPVFEKLALRYTDEALERLK